ncbi:MAG: ATP-binding cassette domain-containing protein [Flavipsychrobacter sp.]|nr:ATP-binding cassette domain-containing protein [Flavipsychrobacter sp.]
MQPVLSIQQISKSYGPIRALESVSFNVPEGSVFGILGPNGSGKTTLLGIVLDVLVANGGSYKWFDGMSADAARRQIGALLETPNFYHYLTAIENLEITAAIKERGHEDKLRVLELTGLLQRKDSKFLTYSLGMKQRLAIAAALLGNPKILVLDEPTNGLDPAGIAEIRELIVKLSNEGITVIMASHLLDEVEKVCTHVAILKRGNLLVTGHVDDVLHSEDQIEVRADDLKALQQLLTGMNGIKKIQPGSNTLLLSCDAAVQPAQINEYCMQGGIILTHLLLRKKSLESKFIELTN